MNVYIYSKPYNHFVKVFHKPINYFNLPIIEYNFKMLQVAQSGVINGSVMSYVRVHGWPVIFIL